MAFPLLFRILPLTRSRSLPRFSQVSERAGITAMPTFQVYKNGKKVAEMRGANKDGLANLVAQNK